LSISELADVMQISEGTVLVFINELLNYQMISQADGGKYQPTFKGRSLIRLDKSHHG
jgi:Mn-dependent DtxR family transcriptional regulator